jgi:aspartate aminotransferase
MKFADRVTTLQPTAVNRVMQEAKALQAEGRSLVSLMRGQPDTPTPRPIIEAAEKALRDGLTGYPDNQGEPILRQAIAEKLWRDNDLTYDSNREILVTDGATGGLFTALATLIQPGDDVLLPDPIYDAYASPIALWGGRAVPVASTIRNGRFTIDRAALDAAHTPRSRVLLLNSPWNPTGTVFTRAELQACAEFATQHDLFLVSDEIYETLVYDERRHVSIAALSRDVRARTVVVNSLSKSYAMTGWRVGYCAAPEEIIRAMLLVWQQFSRADGRSNPCPAHACRVSSPPRPGREGAGRPPRRRAARSRRRAVRDARRARPGLAVRHGAALAVARGRRSPHRRRGLRSRRRGNPARLLRGRRQNPRRWLATLAPGPEAPRREAACVVRWYR